MPDLFLNTKVESNNPLENAGNLFLTPVRLLWHGKTVSVKGNEWYAHHSFQKNDRMWWKKALAVLALPIAVPIGSGLKALSRLSSHTRKLSRDARPYVDALNDRMIRLAETARLFPTGFTSTQVDLSKVRPLINRSEARYPDELMEAALIQAFQELIDERVISPQEMEDPSDELIQSACTLAALNLIAKAEAQHDCMGDSLSLNDHVKVKDSKPEKFFDDEKEEVLIYHHDALSTIDEGVKPLTVKKNLTTRNIAPLKREIYTSANKAYGKAAQLDEAQKETLGHLLLIGKQIQNRYLNQFEVQPVDGRVRSFPKLVEEVEMQNTSPYDDAVNIYEVMGIALKDAAQELIDNKMVEDSIDNNLSRGASQLAIFNLLEQSRLFPASDGNILQFSKNVGVYFKDPVHLFAEGQEKTIFKPNGLMEYQLDAYPTVNEEALRIKEQMDDLTEQESKALREILMIKDRLIEGKDCTDEINAIYERYNISKQLQQKFEGIMSDIDRLGYLVMLRYYSPLGSEIYLKLNSPEVLEKIDQKVEAGPSEQKIKRPPLFDYLPRSIRKGIVIKQKKSKKIVPVTQQEAGAAYFEKEKLALVQRQYKIIPNGDHTFSCCFGALAQGFYAKSPDSVFGTDFSQSSIHVKGLRKAVADYYRRNPEQFFHLIREAETSDEISYLNRGLQWNLVRDKEDENEVKAAIFQRAEDIDESVKDRQAWATDVEIKILAEIFGRPIYVFDVSEGSVPLGITEDGKIDTINKFGDEFAGEPVYLVLHGNHFKLAIPR